MEETESAKKRSEDERKQESAKSSVEKSGVRRGMGLFARASSTVEDRKTLPSNMKMVASQTRRWWEKEKTRKKIANKIKYI